MVSSPVAKDATTAPSANGTAGSNRQIRKVAVLGAGIMGSRIAMHFANIGVPALLLDMVPRELTPQEQAAGLTMDSPAVRNRIVNGLFDTAVKSSPAPLYDKSFTSRVELGNFTDHMSRIADCDWVIEVVVENLDIKRKIYEEVEKHRKPGTLITSNTSGIPIHMLSQGRSDDFRRNFAGTHFFNPPRYLRLLEIIPTPDTDPAVTDFLMEYGDRFLGKQTVLCKDTPGFIANRIGMFAFADTFRLVLKHNLLVEEIDALTGPVIGRAKSATFRTSDIVGLDTAMKVCQFLYDTCTTDEKRDLFQVPDFVKKMAEKNLLGDKTGGGFYKKTKGAGGESEIVSLDLHTFEYKAQTKLRTDALGTAKKSESLPDKLRVLMAADDKYGAFLRELHYGLFAYCSNRIPEIADELYRLDQAVAAGYGYSFGPFEAWDILGVKDTVAKMKADGIAPAKWVEEMVAAGHESFYKVEKGKRLYYDPSSKNYKAVPMPEGAIVLDNIRSTNVVWKNIGCTIFDLGDGVLGVEFQTKMNTIGAEIIEGVHHALDLAEKSGRGVVIGNQGENFSAGANIGMIFMMAAQQDWKQLEEAVRVFQNTSMRLRYSSVPVVLAAHGLTLGGGCEFAMHADSTLAAGETYMGLVEAGVGLLPGGGGTKELAVRISDEYMAGDIELNTFQHYIMNAMMAKVATSGVEAFGLGLLNKKKDRMVVSKDRLLGDAKRRVLELSAAGYTAPAPRKDIRVLGKNGLGGIMVVAHTMLAGGYISEHDKLIAEKIGYVVCGGDLSQPSLVSEQYLLDLEREAFLQLAGTQKTLERIQHMLTTGKPLRN